MISGSGSLETTPDMFPRAQLLAKDFDGTVAQTFEKSPNGLGVHEVHEIIIDSMFGQDALETYLRNGGLRNRPPDKVVQEAAPDADEDELERLTADFIEQKLSISLSEIGTRFPDGEIWPRPTRGYLELCESIAAARSEGRLIDDIIISSGHEPFIEKTYRAWNIGQPTHVLAEDTVRRFALDLPIDQRVKPSPVLMDIARQMWRDSYSDGLAPDASDDELRRIVFVGDDPVNDGELAKNSGVDFLLLQISSSLETWRSVARRLQLGQAALREA
jgi:hypothetical protein